MEMSSRAIRPLLWAATLALALCALALVFTHIAPPYNTIGAALSAPQAAHRAGERMSVPKPTGAINVNTATVDELCQIEGVGPSLAQSIVDEREQNGAFYYAADLLNVKGIGEKTLSKLLPQICLE